ncbi:hypothetical protein ACS0TY_018379 [Phlomoides rotata]
MWCGYISLSSVIDFGNGKAHSNEFCYYDDRLIAYIGDIRGFGHDQNSNFCPGG